MKNYNKTKWGIWSVLTFSFVIAYFLRLSTAVISDNLSLELGFSNIEISNIASFTLYAYALMQIPGGILLDRYGPRKVCSIGMLIGGIGSILFGFIEGIKVAYLSRVMIGAGVSVTLLSVLKFQGGWFKKEEFTSATAKFSFIGCLGGVFATFPLVFLNDIIGWRNSFILIGIIGVLCGIVIYLVVRDTPKEYGFKVDIEVIEEEKLNLLKGLKSVFRNKATWYNSLIMFSMVGITTAFSSLWIVSYITDVYEVKKSVAAFIASFLTYGLVFGALFMDYVFARIKTNKFNVIKFGNIINIFIWSYIILISNVKPPIFTLPILFFIVGTINMSHIQAFNDVQYKNEEKYSGLSTSVVNTCEFIGSGIINLFIAFTIDMNASNVVLGYKLGFVIFIAMNIIALISANMGIREDKKALAIKVN
ncbi:MFS transporter [Romboutsia sp. MSSM.1001216sp_RTP31141st1_G3_RTP31141_220114]|uniref:MFS transporter n=1 Tax=unclassified Romboutsia TaxID=2626894 RepID=UPI0031B5E87F